MELRGTELKLRPYGRTKSCAGMPQGRRDAMVGTELKLRPYGRTGVAIPHETNL